MVGFLLMVSGNREAETFQVFNGLVSNHVHLEPYMDGLTDFYKNDFKLTFKYMTVFQQFFKEILPKLYAHFKAENFIEHLWLFKWLQTCFLYSFPFGFCIRVWDNIFAYGTRFLLMVSMAILTFAEKELLKLSDMEFLAYFEQFKDEKEIQKQWGDVNNIMEVARRIGSKHMTKRRIDQLFKIYDSSNKI